MTEDSATERIELIDGTERVRRLAADPRHAEAIARISEEMDQADRRHAMTLAMVRKAANLTQQELADRLGVRQETVSNTEARTDLLLSTLRSYLKAAGADISLLVRLPDGEECELNLEQFKSA